MKRITTLLIALVLLACNAPGKAQDDPKLRKDHTYSTHNYKHPNKAAAAKRWEDKDGVPVRNTPLWYSQQANYKTQFPGQPPVGGVTVPHTTNENLANRNYKMQKPSINSGQDTTLSRKRTKNRSESTIGQ